MCQRLVLFSDLKKNGELSAAVYYETVTIHSQVMRAISRGVPWADITTAEGETTQNWNKKLRNI